MPASRKTEAESLEFASLEAFVDEGVRRSVAKGYHPTAFLAMRERHSLIEAIRRLVESADMQSGFYRLQQLGLLDWSLEAAVIRFPDSFSRQTREYAGFRLSQAKERRMMRKAR
jgi:hypothetical protein